MGKAAGKAAVLLAAALGLTGCFGGETEHVDSHLTPKLMHHGKLVKGTYQGMVDQHLPAYFTDAFHADLVARMGTMNY